MNNMKLRLEVLPKPRIVDVGSFLKPGQNRAGLRFVQMVQDREVRELAVNKIIERIFE